MPFGPVDTSLDLAALEQRVLERWRIGAIPAQALKLREGRPEWIFYEGPPTANGRPGLHHVWARAFKDLYPRFRTMQGYSVPRKGGWDCHGLPVELEVEKELGLHSKPEIEEFGIAEFNQRCRASVERYVEEWAELTERSGVWIDTDNAYRTLDNSYIESVWWLIKRLWDKGLLYEGHKVTPYCGRCGTALSSHEVAQGYQDVVDASIYVRFPITDSNADLLVWTTTPWTLISNVAAAVNAELTYVEVAVGERPLIVEQSQAERLFPGVATSEPRTGAELVGLRYRRPFDTLTVPPGSNGWRVVAADFVTADSGSGIVHLAPAFGEVDALVSAKERLPHLNPVNAAAQFDASVPQFVGRFVKDTDRDIIDDLTARGLLVAEEAYEHSYPHCWRCSTPLIYWAKTSWFAKTSERRADLLAQNERIDWHPEHLKAGRFGKWLEGNVDWALSRDRYWGTPLPIWRCVEGHDTCVGSVAELAELAGRDLSDLDLHRPYIDDITFDCPMCDSTTSTRLLPVLDAWLDSGAMPTAQGHYPFEGGELEVPPAFPAQFICEAIDQTRGWFYSLLALNTLVFDSTPYEAVVCLGHIVDGDGLKMSKSRGNVLNPFEVFDKFGADGVRWYFFSSGQPWTPRRVFDEGIQESTRQTLLTLWNVHSFFATYADLVGWTPTVGQARSTEHVMDRWVLARLDDTVRVATAALEQFDALGAAGAVASFVGDLSNWYVRRSRPRFWISDDAAAFATLYECLVTTAKLLAPFVPFFADEIYTSLTGEESVHLADWPIAQASTIADGELAEQMQIARSLVALGRAARSQAGIKVRQPLRRSLVLAHGLTASAEVLDEVAAELNVGTVEVIEDLASIMSWDVKPNFKVLGPRLGERLGAMKAALAELDGGEMQRSFATDGFVEVMGERIEAGDVEMRAVQHESFALAEEGGVAVALDLELDDELRRAGVARDLIRAINDHRKQLDLHIADRIELIIDGSDAVRDSLAEHSEWVAREVLAAKLQFGPVDGGAEVSVGDEVTRVLLSVIAQGAPD